MSANGIETEGRIVHGSLVRRGSVVQINEKHGRDGWTGALLIVTEVKPWGVQGFVHCIETHDQYSRAYIRLPDDEFDYIGHAALVPEDAV